MSGAATARGGSTAQSDTGDAFATLDRRGFLRQCSNREGLAGLLRNQSVAFYLGYDPTGDSLHAGHLVGLTAMAHLQRAGHRPVLLIGGGTARIGDPSDKDEMRRLLPVETVAANAAAIKRQVGRFIDLDQTIVVDNAEWLADLSYIDFLRDIGRHFSVGRMIGFEAYRRRLQTGLSFLEFNYLLLQAYDYLLLHQRHHCQLQIGGDDQWANIVSGIDLIRRVERTEAFAFTWPLVTMADGSKMGKTAGNALFLDADRVSPYEFYQYWVNVPDSDVPQLLNLLTLLPDDEIARLSALRDRETAAAKAVLAEELTRTVHGEAEAAQARAASAALFAADSGTGDRSAMPTAQLPAAELAAGIGLIDLFARSELCASRSEARRLIQQGGASINGAAQRDLDVVVDGSAVVDGELVLRAGKKRYFRFVVGSGS